MDLMVLSKSLMYDFNDEVTYQHVFDMFRVKKNIVEIIKSEDSCIMSWRWDYTPPVADEKLSNNVISSIAMFLSSTYEFMLIDIFSLKQKIFHEPEPTLRELTLFSRLYYVLPVMFSSSFIPNSKDSHLNRAWLFLELVNSLIGIPFKNLENFNGELTNFRGYCDLLSMWLDEPVRDHFSRNLCLETGNLTMSRELYDRMYIDDRIVDIGMLTKNFLHTRLSWEEFIGKNVDMNHTTLAYLIRKSLNVGMILMRIHRFFIPSSCRITVGRVNDLGKIAVSLFSNIGGDQRELRKLLNMDKASGPLCELSIMFCMANNHEGKSYGFATDVDDLSALNFLKSSDRLLKIVRPQYYVSSFLEMDLPFISLMIEADGKKYRIQFRLLDREFHVDIQERLDLETLLPSLELIENEYAQLY